MSWELGGGYGHLAPFLSLARPLQAEGHTLMLAARNLSAAEAVLGGSSLPYFQAPANFFPRPGMKLHSFAQILLHTAFNDSDELLARARAWRALYALLEPDILVCDHSPTALLAARGLPMRCVVTGNGFVIPPDVSPLPELREWSPASSAELERDEAETLDRANAVLRTLSAPPLERLAQLFAEASTALFTLKELDNYAELRGGTDYWGVPPGPGGAVPQWPKADGKRVFVYGQPFDALPEVLADLVKSGYCSLVYVPKLAQEERARLQGPRLKFADALMDMSVLGEQCDCALMTNGHGTTAAMLLAGKPVLLLPQHLEMMLIAKTVEKSGAGLTAATLDAGTIGERLHRLLHETRFTQAARAVAESYRSKLGPDDAHRYFGALITRLAAEGA